MNVYVWENSPYDIGDYGGSAIIVVAESLEKAKAMARCEVVARCFHHNTKPPSDIGEPDQVLAAPVAVSLEWME